MQRPRPGRRRRRSRHGVRLGAACRRRAARARSPPGPRSSPARARRAARRRRRTGGPCPEESGAFDLQALAHERPALERHRPAGPLEVRGGDAPRLADRRLAAGQRHRLEVRDALERGEVAAQQLAAPERPVGAVARCRRGRARAPRPSRRARRGRPRRARGGAGRSTSGSVLLVRPLRRRGSRDGGRRRPRPGSTPSIVEVEREVGAERAVGGLGVEVAEVRREERLAAARDAERALQLGARRRRAAAARRPAAAAAAGA